MGVMHAVKNAETLAVPLKVQILQSPKTVALRLGFSPFEYVELVLRVPKLAIAVFPNFLELDGVCFQLPKQLSELKHLHGMLKAKELDVLKCIAVEDEFPHII